MMKTGDLVDKLWGQVSRTDLYNFLNVYEKKGLIVRPQKGLIMLAKKSGFLEHLSDFLERRSERKGLERERKILDLDVDCWAMREEMNMTQEEYDSEPTEEKVKRRQKYRKLLKH